MSIVRLYNCPYFINGECSLRSHDNPLIDYWDSNCIAAPIIPQCPKDRAYCCVDVDTDKWSGDTLKLIRTLVNGYRRNGDGNAGEIIDIIEQILERQDDMKDLTSEVLCVSRKWFDKKQAEARQEGREEAWDLARRIVTDYPDSDVYNFYTIDEVLKVFGMKTWDVLKMPVGFAMAKDKKYQEEKKALHIGDEVEFAACGTTRKGYIINLVSPALVRVLTKDLGTYPVGPEECKKTGKHNPDIEKVMASFEKGEKDD